MATRLPTRGRPESATSGSRIPVSRSPSVVDRNDRPRSREGRRADGSHDRGGGAAWDQMQQNQISQSIAEMNQRMSQLMNVVTQQQARMDYMTAALLQGREGNASSSSMPNGGSGQQMPFMQRERSTETIRGSPGIFPASVPRAAENPFGNVAASPSTSSSDGLMPPPLQPGTPIGNQGLPGNPMFDTRPLGGASVPAGSQPVVTNPVAAPRIVMPDGSSFQLGPVSPSAGNDTDQFQGGSSNQLDAFQKSDKWLPPMPTIDISKWKGRIEEITNFEMYVEQLVSWVGLISNSFASEIAFSVRSAREISQETLSPAQVSRGLRLLNILKTTFSGIPKATVILNAYTERSANFLVNGFEALRRLSQEFCVRTRSEAMHFRSQVMSKTYKVSTVTELVNSMDYDIHRYAKLLGSLGPLVDRTGLEIQQVDLAMILLRSLKSAVRQYVVMHSPSESYTDIRAAALRYESAQRLWQEVSIDPKSDNFYAHAVKGKDSAKGKKGDDKGKGKGKDKGKKSGKDSKGGKDSKPSDSGKGKSVAKPTDKCWNCGELGHYGRDCKKPKNDGAGAGKGSKGKDLHPKAKQKGRGKGGKNNAVLGEEPNPEESPSNDPDPPLISLIRFQKFTNVCDESCAEKVSDFSFEPIFQQQNQISGCHSCCVCISSCACSESNFASCQCDLHFIAWICLGDVDCTARHHCSPPSAICFGVQSQTPSEEASWWLLDSGASYSVMSRECSQFYEVVGTMPFPKNIGGNFSAANGSTINMTEFAVVAITVWATDISKKHEPNRLIREDVVPIKIHIHALIAENIVNNVISLGSVLRNGWKPSKFNDVLSLVSDDDRFQLHVDHHQNCPWLKHEFHPGDAEIVGSLASGALDSWNMFEPLPSTAYQMPVQLHSDVSTYSQEHLLHVSVKRDREGNAIPLHRSHGKQKPVDVAEPPDEDSFSALFEDNPLKGDDALQEIDGGAEGDLQANVDSSADGDHPKVAQRKVELQKHVMRGHFPYSPECIQCRQGKPTYKHRRRIGGKDIHELSCDFFFYEEQKFMVLYDSHTGMTGIAPMDDMIQARRWIKHWVAEMGLLGPLSTNYALEVYTDAEQAVSNAVREADIGRPIKVQKAPPQAHEAVGAAESSIRKLKDGMATVRSTLRANGHDLAKTNKARVSAFAYVCMCHNAHSRFRDGYLSPREMVVNRQLPSVETTMFAAVTLAEIPESLSKQAVARYERACYLRPEFSS